jgi:transcriptional regulator with XRE-family HTH domain
VSRLTEDSPQRVRELADFLRTRRERIDPKLLGLPRDARRRTPGLRREEVAVFANVSPTWYTHLEQGRTASPSMQKLRGLADVLRLSDEERTYLYGLARATGPTGRPAEAGRVAAELSRLVHRSAGDYPAFVLNPYGDVLSWNAATADWYTDFGALPAERRNLLWWVFSTAEARERLVDWGEEALDLVARLRAGSVHWMGESRPTELVSQLRRTSPQFRRLWDEHHVRAERSRVRRIRHPRHGVVALRLVMLREAVEGSPRVVFHLRVADVAG